MNQTELISEATESTNSCDFSRRTFLGLGAAALSAVAIPAVLSGCSSIDEADETQEATETPAAGDYAYDIVIKGGTLYPSGDVTDLGIKDGIITLVGEIDGVQGAQVLDATDKLVSPSFVDAHQHLPKTQLINIESYLNDSIANEAAWYAEEDPAYEFGSAVAWPCEATYQADVLDLMDFDDAKEEIKSRIRTTVEWAIANGTGVIKSHSSFGKVGLLAELEIKEEYADKIDIEVIPSFTTTTGDEDDIDERTVTQADIISYAEAGTVKFLGGYYYAGSDFDQIDQLFAFAQANGLAIDLHVCESDDPDLSTFEYIVDKTTELGMEGLVACSHLTALDAVGVDQDELAAVVAKAAAADVHVISLPSCNMYMMGRRDANPHRRGITRVDSFLEAGANVSLASDNVRDAWRPYGNADMLQEVLTMAHAMYYAYPSELETLYEFVTVNPAKQALLENYGTEENCAANLVVLDGPSASEVILSQSKKLYVIKDGVVVAQDGALI